MNPTYRKASFGVRDSPVETRAFGRPLGMDNNKWEGVAQARQGIVRSRLSSGGANLRSPYETDPNGATSKAYYTNTSNQILYGRLSQNRVNELSAVARRSGVGSASGMW